MVWCGVVSERRGANKSMTDALKFISQVRADVIWPLYDFLLDQVVCWDAFVA